MDPGRAAKAGISSLRTVFFSLLSAPRFVLPRLVLRLGGDVKELKRVAPTAPLRGGDETSGVSVVVTPGKDLETRSGLRPEREESDEMSV